MCYSIGFDLTVVFSSVDDSAKSGWLTLEIYAVILCDPNSSVF